MSGSGSSMQFPKWDYQEYPKTLARNDFWGQLRWTIMGRRITDAEVATLAEYLRDLLELGPEDVLLDLCCGNGALSARFFGDCAGYTGVDSSAYLIEIAKEYFERPPQYVFFHGDAGQFAASVPSSGSFTKILCCAAFQYLPPATVDQLMHAVSERFPNAHRLVLANLPERDRAGRFFHAGYTDQDLDDYQSQIGRWWSVEQIRHLAAQFGWNVEARRLPEEFFNSKYRFEAVLSRS